MKKILRTWRKWAREFSRQNPRLRVIVGVGLILVGLAALVTPLTPGSWLALIGLELLGVRILSRFLRDRDEA